MLHHHIQVPLQPAGLIPCLMAAVFFVFYLFLLSLHAPTQLAKAAPTPHNVDLQITPRASRHQRPPLPELPTADIDRSSLTVGDGGVLVHYISNSVDFTTVTQAIIVIHGFRRDAANSFADMQGALEATNKSKVVIMSVRSLLLYLKD